MAVANLCAHEDCEGWCRHKDHTLYGAENGIPSAEQYGVLYTWDGRRFPDEVSEQIRDRVQVPPHFAHLRDEQPPEEDLPNLDFDLLAELDELGETMELPKFETRSLGRGVQERRPVRDMSPKTIGRK